MNPKEIRKKSIYGMKICLCMFISWTVLGFLFGNIRTDDGYMISSPLICLIVILFMYVCWRGEKKQFENHYAEG